MNLWSTFLDLDALYEETKQRWIFVGKVEFFNRKLGRIDSFEVTEASPLSTLAVSKSQALNNIKQQIRTKLGLPQTSCITFEGKPKIINTTSGALNSTKPKQQLIAQSNSIKGTPAQLSFDDIL